MIDNRKKNMETKDI